ncbi:hypothetical protein AAFF_G00143710 [Aldrovandia affinis]|uniref:Uncharacterized protein n=1 Tax=Aldrovandia affinis TaxID=143900 RepID=A0AAD7T0E9_9TELE|nr:hypothetical protein AAFF_G00143710 [Aldrovandia affinis]
MFIETSCTLTICCSTFSHTINQYSDDNCLTRRQQGTIRILELHQKIKTKNKTKNLISCNSYPNHQKSQMEHINKIIPFTKEMMSQKPNGHMVTVYLVGSAVAFLGVAFGLVERVCQPFSTEEPLDEELAWLEEREQCSLAEKQRERTMGATLEREVEIPTKKQQQAAAGQRNTANRLHAS